MPACHPLSPIFQSTNGMTFSHKLNSCLICSNWQEVTSKYQCICTSLVNTITMQSPWHPQVPWWCNWAPNLDTTWHWKILQSTSTRKLSLLQVLYSHHWAYFYLQHHCFYQPDTYHQVTLPTPEETLVEAAKQLGTALTEVTQNNPLYSSLTNYKGIQQLVDICGNKCLRVADSKTPTGDNMGITAPRMSQQQPSHPPLHWYPTGTKALNAPFTTSHIHLPTYLVDAIDLIYPNCVSDAFINTVTCLTTGKKWENRYLIANAQMCHTWDNRIYD